jgi:hypothetical protein
VQGALELMGIPYTGSGVMASAIAMDKWRTKLVWLAAGLPTPRFAILDANTDWDAVVADLGLPIFVKPVHEGSSMGATKVTEAGQLKGAWELAPDSIRWCWPRSSSPVRSSPRPSWASGRCRWCASSRRGATTTTRTSTSPTTPSISARAACRRPRRRIQAAIVRCAKVLGCRGWGRADLILRDDGSFTLLEINTAPGMTNHSLVPMSARVAGLSFEALCLEILPERALADERNTSNVPPEPGAKPGRERARAARPARAVEGNGLWDRPQLLNLISDVLMVVGAAGSAMPRWRPCRACRLPAARGGGDDAAGPGDQRPARIRGALVAARQFLHRGPRRCPRLLREAALGASRRRAPALAGGVEVRLEEHVASAYWRVGETGDMRLVNRYGEVFSAASNAKMPVFSGPEGSSSVLLAKFDEFTGKLGPLGKQLVGVSLSAREAWQLKMEDGLTIELGHDQAKAPIDERLARFVRHYPKARPS